MVEALLLTDVVVEEFSARLSVTASELTLVLTGNADMGVRDALQNLLSRLDAEARRLGVATVIVDFRELEFMNSSCFKGFVSWLNDAKKDAGMPRYRVRFVSSASRTWHRRSLHALQCFALDLVTIEVA